MEQQYEMLAVAIVAQALHDYRHAQKNIKKKYDVLGSESKISEIQRFLKSAWFKVLSNLDGEKLIALMESEKMKYRK